MPKGYQQGSLKRQRRSSGEVWLFRYHATRASDGKRVERTITLGTTHTFANKTAAWREVEKRRLRELVNDRPELIGSPRFGELTSEYVKQELSPHSTHPKAHSTIASYTRVLNRRILPRWAKTLANQMKGREVQLWLNELRAGGLALQTLAKTRNIMHAVFRFALDNELLPASAANPIRGVSVSTATDYQAIIISPQQTAAILADLPPMERLVVLTGASTGMRLGEVLGLRWRDLLPETSAIRVTRSWSGGRVGRTKTRASAASVPMTPLLFAHFAAWRAETPYAADDDWIFASFRMKGKQPRTGSIMMQDHLRPAAIKAGVLSPDSKARLGLHNLRSSLATFLVGANVDVKTAQSILRHASSTVTLDLYAKGISNNKVDAQNRYFAAMGSKLPEPVSGVYQG